MAKPLENLTEVQQFLGPTSSSAHRIGAPPTQRQRLFALTDELDLFHDPHGQPWVSLPLDDGHQIWPVRSPRYRNWLTTTHAARHHGDIPSDGNLRAAIRLAEARATANRRDRPVFHRHVAKGERFGPAIPQPNTITFDLADGLGRVLEITADAIKTDDGNPYAFSRSDDMRPLPEPQRPADNTTTAGRLRHLLQPATTADFHRLLAWLTAALHPAGPYPVLVLRSANAETLATTAALARSLIDPSADAFVPYPDSDRRLRQTARDHRVLLFPQTERLTASRAATLCRSATEIRRPAIVPLLQSGDEPAPIRHRSLANLTLTVDLADPTQSEPQRWQQFEDHHAEFLGLLALSVSQALRDYPATPPTAGPLTEARRWSLASAGPLGLTAADMMTAYTRRAAPTRADQIIDFLTIFMTTRPVWTGLYTELYDLIPPAIRPGNPRSLSALVKDNAHRLRTAGISYSSRHRRPGSEVTLKRDAPPDNPASPPPDPGPSYDDSTTSRRTPTTGISPSVRHPAPGPRKADVPSAADLQVGLQPRTRKPQPAPPGAPIFNDSPASRE